MKMKLCAGLWLLLAALIFNSCKDSGSPEAVSQLFLVSLNKADFETAAGISTKNTRDILKIMAYNSDGKLTDEQKEKRAESFEVKITGNKPETDSTVIITFNTKPDFLPFKQFRLLKLMDKDGRERWKVDISTLDLAGGSDQYSREVDSTHDGQFHPQPDSIAVQE